MCFTELKWIGVINTDSNDLLCQPNLLPPHISLENELFNYDLSSHTYQIEFSRLMILSQKLKVHGGGWGESRVAGHAQFAMAACQSLI